jgi:hypothetical protein
MSTRVLHDKINTVYNGVFYIMIKQIAYLDISRSDGFVWIRSAVIPQFTIIILILIQQEWRDYINAEAMLGIVPQMA